MRRKRLGDVLRERGHISAEELNRAVQEQQGKLLRLGELLLNQGKVSRSDLVGALEEVTRVPYVDTRTADVDTDVLSLVPRLTARKYCILPVRLEGQRLTVVMADPQNLRTLDELRFLTGKEIVPRFGFRDEIETAIEQQYATLGPNEPSEPVEERIVAEMEDGGQIEFIATSTRHSHKEAMREIQNEVRKQRTPAVRLVSKMIAMAAAKMASDVHVEPQANSTVVRIRVDGVLRELMQVPSNLQNSLISRIKILADMDIAERRAPQDGRVLVQLGRKRLDLRVSTLPTHYGEKVVMRLLDPTAPRLRFRDLGMAEDKVEALERVLAMPQGMLLVTGPTGSGKTTTLYAALSHIHSPGVNIVTVEDPVEYMLEGVNQVQVNTKAGLNFASVLRSILRQDPNVIMVGEIRDRETAEIGLKSAQTGHLVLSTLHTNDSISAVTRLLDLNIAAFMIASSISAVMAQRLVRRLCSACAQKVPVTPEYAAHLESLGVTSAGDYRYISVGCETCDQTGFRGRIGIHEIIVFDDQIRTMVRSGARNEEIRALMRAAGVQFMQDDALHKISSGVTTLEEVLRVISFDTVTNQRCEPCGRELVPAFLYCPYCGAKRHETEAAPSPQLQPAGRGGRKG